MRKNKKIRGYFAPQLKMMLTEKRTLGFKYKEEERLMYIFDELSLKYNCNEGLSQKLVFAFIKKQPHWSQSTHEHRIFMIRSIAKYLNSHGITAYVCDTNRITKTIRKFKPYIFSKKQIEDILYQADTIPKTSRSKSSSLFYPVILRMLYGCGLRISEALNLKIKDVDLQKGLLYIYSSKNYKDRITPMDNSLTNFCINYFKQIHVASKNTDYFFKSPKSGGKYNKSSVYHYFRKLIWQCGISHGGRSKGPRLHDLRHTFCVHSLHQFLKNDVDYRAALPVLSFYLGHSNIAATGKYLRLTAEAYPEILNQMEQNFGHVIPDLGVIKDETY